MDKLQQRPPGLQSWKTLLSGLLQKKLADLCSRVWGKPGPSPEGSEIQNSVEPAKKNEKEQPI